MSTTLESWSARYDATLSLFIDAPSLPNPSTSEIVLVRFFRLFD
jgi:hypothetical protein